MRGVGRRWTRGIGWAAVCCFALWLWAPFDLVPTALALGSRELPATPTLTVAVVPRDAVPAVVGQREADALAQLAKLGLVGEVTRRNFIPLPHDARYHPNRVKLSVVLWRVVYAGRPG